MRYYYSANYYKFRDQAIRPSATVIVPLVLGLISPKSVIDIGCGVGTWLSVFREFGIEDIMGVDGDWIDKKLLRIPEKRFLPYNLQKPLYLNRQFDLVICLETIEHISPENADGFIDSLTRLGPLILFCAAIPFQGGMRHVNEQWQSYWAEYFQKKGYVTLDYIRKKIWLNDNVKFWYAQNILLFVKSSFLENKPLLKKAYENTSTSQLSVVHPKVYLEKASALATGDLRKVGLKKTMRALPSLINIAIQKRLKRLFLINKK